MRKMEFKVDETGIEEYLEMLQKKLPQYDINISNANDFYILWTEKENCKNCKGLNFCKNANIGFYTEYTDGFQLNPCKYKKEHIQQNNKESLIKTLYLPQNILEASFDDYHINTESRKKIHKKMAEFIEQYSELENKKGLYLYGSFSIGKTYTLGCIANELARNHISCLLIYFPDLVVDLKSAIGTPRFESLINMLKSVEVLMLDDVGSENMTAWLRDEILGPVLNYRVLENKPLFLSSNIAPQEIEAHFAIDKSPANLLKAKRLVSRLHALVNSVNMDDCEKYKR